MEKVHINQKAASDKKAMVLLVIGWICAITSLIYYPFIFGVIGVIMGIITSKSGNRKAVSLIVASIVFLGIGLLYGGVIQSFVYRAIGISPF